MKPSFSTTFGSIVSRCGDPAAYCSERLVCFTTRHVWGLFNRCGRYMWMDQRTSTLDRVHVNHPPLIVNEYVDQPNQNGVVSKWTLIQYTLA